MMPVFEQKTGAQGGIRIVLKIRSMRIAENRFNLKL
jgi:hypothetical protein